MAEYFRLTAYVSQRLLARLDTMADERGVKLSDIVRSLIEAECTRWEELKAAQSIGKGTGNGKGEL